MNMLSPEEADALGKQLEDLRCVDPSAGGGLFTYVLKGEPEAEGSRYETHLSLCEYCRIALEFHRYQRDVIHVVGRAGSEGEV
jgi:hypothetical protein